MRTSNRFAKRLAAVVTLAIGVSSFSAQAEDLDAITRLIMPAPYELTVTGIGPAAFSVTWKDVARIDQAYELEWTLTPENEESWAPATQNPLEASKCAPDNFGTLPYIDTTNTSSPLHQYNDPRPARCFTGLTSLRNRTNTGNIALPYAETPAKVRWFRIRGIFPNNIKIPAAPGNNNVEFPAQVKGLIHSPWSGIDPAILGPLPPTNVSLIPAIPQVQVVWANAAMGDPDFTGNRVERRHGQTLISTPLPSSAVTYLDGPLEYNTVYTYRVVAQRSRTIPKPGDPNTGADPDPNHLEESYSASHPEDGGLRITTPPIPAPGDPTNLIATYGAPPQVWVNEAGQANLQWFDNANDEDGFLIEFGHNGTNWLAQTAIGPKQGNGFVTYSQFNIPPDTQRFYRVFAYRVTPYGKSNPSNVASIISIPKAPLNLTQTSVTSFQTVLTFKDNSTYEQGFIVEYCNPSGFSCPDDGSPGDWAQAGSALPAQSGTGSILTFTDGRFASTTLKYRAKAFNTSGYSKATGSVSSTTPAAPLNAPSNLVAVADPQNPHKVTLTWQDNTNNADGQPNTSDDEEEAFKIEYADPGMPFLALGTVGTDITTFIDTTVPGKHTRCYRVRAAIASQTRISDPSNKSCAVTVAGPIPNAPSGLIAVPWVGNPTMAVELTWQDNSGPDSSEYSEDGFIIEHSNNLQTWREIGRAARNVTVFRYGNFPPNSFQYFRVKAFNFHGHSGYSNNAQVLLKGPPRPVWIHPAKDNTVDTSACSVDGSFTASFNPAITDIQIQIVRKIGLDQGTYTCNSTPNSCTYNNNEIIPEIPPQNRNVILNWNGPGTFKLNFHFRKNVTYELHARAVNAHGASSDAFIATYAVLADCPLG